MPARGLTDPAARCESLAGLSRAGKTGGWIAAGVFLAVAWLGPAGVSSAAAPRPHVVGNQLVDARSSQAFVPRGVNWPSFEYACSDGYGYSNSTGARTVGPDAAGAAAIARWHVNTVRLPLNQDCWLGDDGLPKFGKASGYRRAVRKWVATLHRAGLVVVLDLHWSGPAGVVANGQRAMADDRSDNFWGSVARTFRRDRSVIFDVFNEPYSRYGDTGLAFDLTWDCWLKGGCNAPRAHIRRPLTGSTFATIGMQALVDAIRATGARQPIMVSGRDFANDLSGWAANRPTDDQLVASFHNYNNQPCSSPACWDATIAPLVTQVPVVSGEFGANDCSASFVESFMDWADLRGVGYLMWAWWVLPHSRCSTHAVLANVKGDARPPNGTALKAHLAALAPRLTLAGPKTQVLDAALELRVRCSQPCRARAAGQLLVATRSAQRAAASTTFRLQPAARALPVGRTRTLAIKIPRKARRAAAAALRRSQSVSARITIVVTAGSHSSQKTRSVKLRAASGSARAQVHG
jgi:endoglucanase